METRGPGILPMHSGSLPGAIDRAVSAEQARGVVAFPAFIDDGAGEAQAITEHDSGIAWSTRVPARDH